MILKLWAISVKFPSTLLLFILSSDDFILELNFSVFFFPHIFVYYGVFVLTHEIVFQSILAVFGVFIPSFDFWLKWQNLSSKN